MHTDPCCGGPITALPASPSTLTRRRMLVAGAAGAGALALRAVPAGATATDPALDPLVAAEGGLSLEGSTKDYGFLPPRPASEVHRRPIMFPILGKTSWSDTYLAPRGGGRRHEGQDLMAAKMLKLLAVVDGTIIELRHRSSGNSLYLKGDDGWYYCYLHINNDTPGTDDGRNEFRHAFASGMANGVRVKKGQHIAFVGDSGNAEASGSHCHFEIRMPHAKWYNAAAVNAAPSLDAADEARTGPSVPSSTFAPWDNANELITRQYQDLLGRSASAANLTYWGGVLNEGRQSPQQMMDYFLQSEECDSKTHAVARLYEAFFLRRPDASGFAYWTDKRRTGMALTAIADAFARSPEFTNRYGTLSNGDFVDRIYRNVLGRPADAEGRAFWRDKIDGGRSRGTVMVQFSDSPENRSRQALPMHVVVAHGTMLRRMPSANELTLWTTLLANGTNTVQDMLAILRISDEYKWIVATTD